MHRLTEYGSPLGFCVHGVWKSFRVLCAQWIEVQCYYKAKDFFLITAFFALKKFWLDCLSWVLDSISGWSFPLKHSAQREWQHAKGTAACKGNCSTQGELGFSKPVIWCCWHDASCARSRWTQRVVLWCCLGVDVACVIAEASAHNYGKVHGFCRLSRFMQLS